MQNHHNTLCEYPKDLGSHLKHSQVTFQSQLCGHKLCQSCILRLFQHERSIPCPFKNPKTHKSCTIQDLIQDDFTRITNIDLEISRDFNIRRKYAILFKAEPSDFNSLSDYDSYLEKVELLLSTVVHKKSNSSKQAKLHLEKLAEHISNIVEQRQTQDIDSLSHHTGGGPIQLPVALPDGMCEPIKGPIEDISGFTSQKELDLLAQIVFDPSDLLIQLEF